MAEVPGAGSSPAPGHAEFYAALYARLDLEKYLPLILSGSGDERWAARKAALSPAETRELLLRDFK